MVHQGKNFGLVLRTRNYHEKDRWVTILTQEEGRIDYLAKGVRSLTSRRRASLQAGSLVRASWIKSGETRLLTEVVLDEGLVSVHPNLENLRDISSVLEIVFHIALEDQTQGELFQQTTTLLRYLRDNPEYNRGRVREALLQMLYDQGIATPDEVHAKSAAQVFESVVGRSLKSFPFLNI